MAYCTEDIKLREEYASTAYPLDRAVIHSIQHEAYERLERVEAILRHIMEVAVVRNQRKNFLNIRLRRDYVTLLHHVQANEVFFCFFLPDKLEPFITITALHVDQGKLVSLDASQVDALEAALNEFRTRFGISGESYHYTGLVEREETERFARGGGVGGGGSRKAHSKHFHLKMRVSSQMCRDRLPALRLFNLARAREVIEPVRYAFGRETISRADVLKLLRDEAHSAH